MSVITCKGYLAVLMILILINPVYVFQAIAAEESQFELIAGNLIVQNQSYSTNREQIAAHSASEIGTDTEAFAFSSTPQSIDLGQTSAAAAAGQYLGFYNATTYHYLNNVEPTTSGLVKRSYPKRFLDPVDLPSPGDASLVNLSSEDLRDRKRYGDNRTALTMDDGPYNNLSLNDTLNDNETLGDLPDLNITPGNVSIPGRNLSDVELPELPEDSDAGAWVPYCSGRPVYSGLILPQMIKTGVRGGPPPEDLSSFTEWMGNITERNQTPGNVSLAEQILSNQTGYNQSLENLTLPDQNNENETDLNLTLSNVTKTGLNKTEQNGGNWSSKNDTSGISVNNTTRPEKNLNDSTRSNRTDELNITSIAGEDNNLTSALNITPSGYFPVNTTPYNESVYETLENMTGDYEPPDKPPMKLVAEAISVPPLTKQANKPFTYGIAPPADPGNTSSEDIVNTTGWERFMINNIGWSDIDSAYTGHTSAPAYINPSLATEMSNQFRIVSDSLRLTLPGSYIQRSFWCL